MMIALTQFTVPSHPDLCYRAEAVQDCLKFLLTDSLGTEFLPGDEIVLDLNVRPRDGDFVVRRNAEGTFTLLAYDSADPRSLVGTIIERRRSYWRPEADCREFLA